MLCDVHSFDVLSGHYLVVIYAVGHVMCWLKINSVLLMVYIHITFAALTTYI